MLPLYGNHFGKVIQEIQIAGKILNNNSSICHALGMVRRKQKVFQPLGVSPALRT